MRVRAWFAGIILGAVPIKIRGFAFGRDNTGTLNDRAVGEYTVQTTVAPNPSAATADWASIGRVVYSAAGSPWLRHVFTFNTSQFEPLSTATGLRILTVPARRCFKRVHLCERRDRVCVLCW